MESRVSLRSQVLSGLIWTGGARAVSQVLTWVITIVVIRLLTPSDYGLLAMATLFVSFLTMLAEAGMGPALVQTREVDDVLLRRAFGVIVLVDVALFMVQFATAPLIAIFFEEERLVWIIRVLAFQFLIAIFGVIPSSLLARRLDFKRPSTIELASTVLGSLTVLYLALRGYGVWALVIGNLTARLANTIALNFFAPYLKLPDFSMRGMGSLMAFGGQLSAAVIMRFVYSQADVFIAGKMLGKELVGFYSVSMHLASLPVQKISSVVNQVAYPAFARAQQTPEAIAGYVLKGVRLLSFVSFPVLWGISSISDEMVGVLLGPKWQTAALPLQMLSLVMPISMLSPFFNTALLGIGHGRTVFNNVLTAFIVMPAAFLVGARWGLLGLSTAWVVCFPVVFLLNVRRALPLVQLNLSTVLRTMHAPFLASIAMYVSVYVARQLLLEAPPPLRLAALVMTGVASYAVVTVAINMQGLKEFGDLVGIRRLRGERFG